MEKNMTGGQKHQIKGFADLAFEAAIDELGLSREAAQKIIRKGTEFRGMLRERFRSALIASSTPREYTHEEVESGYGYLSGYRKPNSVDAQANKLRELFSGIGDANRSLADTPVPYVAEGKFVIPRWQKIAPTYSKAVEAVLDKLRVTYGDRFCNYIANELGAKYLHEGAAKKAALRKIGKSQAGYDLLVVDGQLGLRHRGRSVRRAREVMESGKSGEFGFGAFEVAITLLTHPDRIQHYDDLWIDCAGDEYSPGADGHFVCAPLFRFYAGDLGLFTSDFHEAFAYCGSASGFYPRSVQPLSR